MNRSRFQILLIGGLLALLGVLAALQYIWLAQISVAEKDRLTRRLQSDTQRFSEDFNREIQGAYFNFQTDKELWQNKNWAQFNERYEFWRDKTAYQNLIKSFYFFENKPDAQILQYDAAKREFIETNWTNELENVKTNAMRKEDFEPFDEANFALVMPIHEASRTFKGIMIRKSAAPESLSAQTKIDLPEAKGFLIIMLDESVIKTQILPDLAKKNFPENDFNLAVTGKSNQKIFQTQKIDAPDSSAKIFNLAPDNLWFFASRDVLPRTPNSEIKDLIVNQKIQRSSVSRIETRTFATNLPEEKANKTFKIEINGGEKPRTNLQNSDTPQAGIWTLEAQHSTGSIDNFIIGTRNENLAVSFGILGLLAVSLVLIFVSAQRAKIFAQRQIDFVSSVSHEFRTPLAVIYSAGENLADGVAKEENQVSRYGELIKGEGRKLSKMVEQILDFAGANSGKKKYDLREQNVGEIVENALRECQPLIDEKEFTVEKDLAENLPNVKADANALSQAIQNLIFNSLKYSNGAKWLKISANNGGGKIKIAVEDKGIGIAPRDLKHIFEPFYRAKVVVDEQIHGNGLGLSLVKETIEAHGGKISAESEVGKGSKFTILLVPKEISRG